MAGSPVQIHHSHAENLCGPSIKPQRISYLARKRSQPILDLFPDLLDARLEPRNNALQPIEDGLPGNEVNGR